MRLRRIAMPLLVAPLLAAGIYAAAVRGLADAHYTTARLELTAGVPKDGAPRPEAIGPALASLREARMLEPANPHFVEQVARLEELQALRLGPRAPARREGLRQSLAQYREAAAMRPGSPYVWANIAMLKARLNDMDFEFYGALERAARLGPWEPQVQIAMVDIGMATWGWLAKPGREWVLGAMERGLLRQAPEIRRIAAIHGSLPRLCADVGGSFPRITDLCVRK
jgi:hypothetical protein